MDAGSRGASSRMRMEVEYSIIASELTTRPGKKYNHINKNSNDE